MLYPGAREKYKISGLSIIIKQDCVLPTSMQLIIILEEVPVKWTDRPSATEMERGCASEMDRQTKCHKNENATEMNKI